MKVQIYSDLHIEFYKSFPRIQPLCDVLILAGDIGCIHHDQFEPFFNYVSENWKKVFYVLGNHEYYGTNHCFYKTQKKYAMFFEKYDNIILLDGEKSILHHCVDSVDNENKNTENIYILGTTLWSQASPMSKTYVNCFKKIKYFNEELGQKMPVTTDMYNSWNLQQLTWIFQEIQNIVKENLERKVFQNTQSINPTNHKIKIMIVTHYPMTLKHAFHEKYSHEPYDIKYIFANDVHFDELLTPQELELVDIVCISGHTHLSHDFCDNFTILDDSGKKVGEKSIRFISNQMGYKDEVVAGETGFSMKGLYEIY